MRASQVVLPLCLTLLTVGCSAVADRSAAQYPFSAPEIGGTPGAVEVLGGDEQALRELLGRTLHYGGPQDSTVIFVGSCPIPSRWTSQSRRTHTSSARCCGAGTGSPEPSCTGPPDHPATIYLPSIAIDSRKLVGEKGRAGPLIRFRVRALSARIFLPRSAGSHPVDKRSAIRGWNAGFDDQYPA